MTTNLNCFDSPRESPKPSQSAGNRIIAYNSCRNRHCPKCQGAAARRWLAEREAELLPTPYYHVVFTLPAAIGDIAHQNKAVIYDLLFKASAETVITIAVDPKHLGARIGVTSVLHTWGSALTHHPHIHMIVPGGGVSLDGQSWIGVLPTRGFLPWRFSNAGPASARRQASMKGRHPKTFTEAAVCGRPNLGRAKLKREFPRLCRGGSRSLTFSAVLPV